MQPNAKAWGSLPEPEERIQTANLETGPLKEKAQAGWAFVAQSISSAVERTLASWGGVIGAGVIGVIGLGL